MQRVTHAMLKQIDACSFQRRLFRKYYPRGAQVTVATARRAKRLGLDVTACARLFLDTWAGREEYVQYKTELDDSYAWWQKTAERLRHQLKREWWRAKTARGEKAALTRFWDARRAARDECDARSAEAAVRAIRTALAMREAVGKQPAATL